MNNSRIGYVFVFISVLPLFLFDEKTEGAGWAIVVLLILLSLFTKSVISSTEKLLSPISMLVLFNSLYTIMGITMWLYREINFKNWEGEFWFVLYVYVAVSFIVTFLSIHLLDKKKSRLLYIDKQKMKLKGLVFFIPLILEYVGIYLFTAGFKIIPLLMPDIDEARFDLGQIDRPGAGLGALLINFGILCVIHLFYSKKSLLFKIPLFLVIYIPYILYGGRFLMVMPLLLVAIMAFIQRVKIIKVGLVAKSVVFLAIAFLVMMFYGTYRQTGNDVETEFVLDFLTADLFPEFRGSIGSYSLNNKDLSLDYIGVMLTCFLPGSFLGMIGIDKASQISIGSYVAQLLGFDGNSGIRTSFTGELLLTNPMTFVLIWMLLFIIVLRINTLFFKEREWNIRKLLMLYFGLNLGTIIPYGISLLSNTIIMIVVVSVFSSFAYKKQLTNSNYKRNYFKYGH